MNKLLTPLVLFTVVFLSLLGLIRLVLLPDTWVSSLAAMLFLPIVLGVLLLKSNHPSQPKSEIKIHGKLRAALVAAGVALGCALLLSITEALGLTEAIENDRWRSMAVLLPAFIAAFADIMSARLEKKAMGESD